jgi:hypothetical protein
MLHLPPQPMVNILIIAAGAVAAFATALAIRKNRNAPGPSSTSVGPVSEEWLSNARGQGEQHW